MRHAGHAKRIIELLESQRPCNACPCQALSDRYHRYVDHGDIVRAIAADRAIDNYCFNICRSFISITEDEDEEGNQCPCFIFGPEGAAKRTWLALEAKGFI